jgi:RNA polymerase sigma-70 factor, ECF subfamily
MSPAMASGPEFPTDGALVARVLAGDGDAYARLVRRHQAALYRHALGMVGDADATSDLVQDTFVKGYSNLARCQDPERFGYWIFRILRNRCLDYLKNRRRSDVSLEEGAAHIPAASDPEADLERAEFGRSLGAALETLPDGQREAFLMKHVHELSYEEIAKILGASESALKMRVKRAREALQSMLGDPEERSDVTQCANQPSYGRSGAMRTLVEPGGE